MIPKTGGGGFDLLLLQRTLILGRVRGKARKNSKKVRVFLTGLTKRTTIGKRRNLEMGGTEGGGGLPGKSSSGNETEITAQKRS